MPSLPVAVGSKGQVWDLRTQKTNNPAGDSGQGQTILFNPPPLSW